MESTNLIEATEDTFDAVLARPGLTLVDFWAGWCGPCVRFAPVFAETAAAHPEMQFVKVDTEDQEALSMRFEIQSIPTLIAFRDSRIVHRASGAMSRSALEALLKGLGTLDAKTIEKRHINMERTARGEHPEGVPSDAEWDEDEERWLVGKITDDGKQGRWKAWRADGTFATELGYVDDCLEGEAREFHEDGSLASVRTFASDTRTGTHVFYAASGFSTATMPFRQVAANVARVEIDHDHEGGAATYRAFDRDGKRVQLANGEPFPDRPASLPATAAFDEDEGCFIEATTRDGAYVGLVRKWDSDGRVLREMTFDDQGNLTGPYLAWADGWYEDTRVKFERGTMRGGHAARVWELLDENRQVLHSVELGEPLGADAVWTSPVTDDRARTAAEWERIAHELAAQRRHSEALIATARAAGVAKNPAVLIAFTTTSTLGRSEKNALDLANNAAQSEDFSVMTNAIMRGARASSLLQLLCVLADRAGRSQLALDLVDAALTLVPDKHEYLRSRALVLLELGRPEEIADVARRLDAVAADDATMFRQYAQLLFPKFTAWQPLLAADASDRTVHQSLDAVRRVASVYLTRLAIWRDRIVQLTTQRGNGAVAPWLPPNVAELLPAGRVELTKRKVKVKREQVSVDETVSESATLRRLMADWRDDWAALTLLLWAVGEDSVRIPTALAPRRELGRADAAITSFLARLHGDEDTAPDDAHQLDGIAFDDLSSQAANMAGTQMFEMKVLLDWLTDANAVSPWQADLRGEDEDDEDDDD